jgi:hypothetical protein
LIFVRTMDNEGAPSFAFFVKGGWDLGQHPG